MTRKISIIVAALLALTIPAVAQADSGLTASPNPLDLGTVPAGQSYWAYTSPITFTNNGGSSVTIQAITPPTSGGWGYFGSGGTMCTISEVLAPSDSCDIHPIAVWHQDPDSLGVRSGTFSVTTDQGTTDIPVSANFVGAYVNDSTGTNFDWEPGAVGSTVKTKTVTVTAVGNTALNISSVAIDTSISSHPGTPSFSILSDSCTGEAIAPGGSCQVKLQFDGPDDSDYLVFSSNAYRAAGGFDWHGSGVFRTYLSGTRIAPFTVASHSISATSFTLGSGPQRPHGVLYSFLSSRYPMVQTLQVLNRAGHVVRTWTANGYFAEHHPLHPSVWWGGRDNAGNHVKPGIYHFRVRLSLWGYHTTGGYQKVTVKRP
jgi:hypothetical protein